MSHWSCVIFIVVHTLSSPYNNMKSLKITAVQNHRPGAHFNKEVQPTLSLNLNSELTYREMGNSRVFSFRTTELC